MSAIDAELARGMQKLTRASWPVKVIKMPSALARAKAELEAVQQARTASNEGFLEKAKTVLKLGMKTPSLDKQAEVLQEKIKRLEEDVIEGELVPLSEREQWSVRANFVHIELFLKSQLQKEGKTEEIKEANKAADKTLDLIGNQVWMSKWVGYALRERNSKDQFEPYWPEYLTPPDLEPSVIAQLYFEYHNAFTPSEAELKKSSAPTTRRTS